MAALEKPRDEGSSYIFELQFFFVFLFAFNSVGS